jgi:hypothetical protein
VYRVISPIITVVIAPPAIPRVAKDDGKDRMASTTYSRSSSRAVCCQESAFSEIVVGDNVVPSSGSGSYPFTVCFSISGGFSLDDRCFSLREVMVARIDLLGTNPHFVKYNEYGIIPARSDGYQTQHG